MSAITIEVPMNRSYPDRLSTFEFGRDQFGQGFWVAKTRIGQLPPNTIVHQDLFHELNHKAREAGLSEEHNFAMSPPKPEKEEKPKRHARKTRKNDRKVPAGMLGGFNPFALSFPSE